MEWMLAGLTWEGEFEMLSFIVERGEERGEEWGEVKFLIDTPLC